MNAVAILGAGPSGLAAARWMREVGFEPVLFEQCERLGGQWSGDPRVSGVWPSMHTNTSRVMTAFSDLAHEPGTPTYPTNQAMRAYLERYAERFDLPARTRLATRVEHLARAGDGWSLRSVDARGALREERYASVVVATGRYHAPSIPAVPGLGGFSGALGAAHTFAYKDPERYRGQRVLVCGCAISALEIASDLAMLGAARVVCANRRQRWVLQKLVAGVPIDCLVHTRFSALGLERLPPAAMAAELVAFIEAHCGHPSRFGAPAPAEDPLAAGFALSQYFLPLVAEGRIEVRPWPVGVAGRRVRFSDGREEEFDAILFGTGFDLDLPFLAEPIRRALALDREHIDLHRHTFHPALPGLAFVGMAHVTGPSWPMIELNARWVAYAWSGLAAAPSEAEMVGGVAAYRAQRGAPQLKRTPALMVDFARRAGVEPEPAQWPELAGALLFGPLSPPSFRLAGPHALPEAPELSAAAAREFGTLSETRLTGAQRERIAALASACGDAALAELARR